MSLAVAPALARSFLTPLTLRELGEPSDPNRRIGALSQRQAEAAWRGVASVTGAPALGGAVFEAAGET